MGAGWGLTQPLAKIAVNAGHRHFGLIFWQMVLGAGFVALFRAFVPGNRGTRFPRLRLDPAALWIYLLIAMIGTLIPNTATYEAIRHLPSGLISIFLSTVPMFAFPVALMLGNERFEPVRFAGLLFGLVGVGLIVAPEASLPERAMVAFIPLALIAPFFYGCEGNIVARWGTAGLSPVDVLYGASIIGALIALPLAVLTGEFFWISWPFSGVEIAIISGALIHIIVYSLYVWMVGVAGAIFAVQVSYLVTSFGVVWAMLILGERFSIWIWGAMALIFVGVFLVQPRSREEAGMDPEAVSLEPESR